jgi:hypothetical protein
VNWIRAEVECEACGKPFQVKFDEGMTLDNFDDLIEVTEDAVRAGYTPNGGILEMCSMEHGHPLCPTCTTKALSIGDEGYLPTWDEILQATSGMARTD